jgi:hypothetical protein
MACPALPTLGFSRLTLTSSIRRNFDRNGLYWRYSIRIGHGCRIPILCSGLYPTPHHQPHHHHQIAPGNSGFDQPANFSNLTTEFDQLELESATGKRQARGQVDQKFGAIKGFAS